MWTTSRYSLKETREIAKNLAFIFNSFYLARGKKNIHKLVEIARRFGEERLCIVNEENSKEIEIIEIDELGNWKWIEKKVYLS